MVTIFEWKDAFILPKEAEIIILVHNAAAAYFQWYNITFVCKVVAQTPEMAQTPN